MGKFLAFLLFCFSISSTVGQNIKKADSIIEALALGATLEIEDRINAYFRVAHHHPDASLSLTYAKLALDLAKSHQKKLLQARSLEEISAIERVLGNNTRAVQASLEALSIYRQLNRKDLQSAVFVQLGNNAVTDEDYTQAIGYFKQALITYDASQQGIYMALTQLNMGEAYRLNAQLDSAEYYFQNALLINDSIQNPIIASYTLGNLGMTYNTLGQLADARSALSTSIKQVRGLGDPYTLSVYLADLALVDQKEQQWLTAEVGFKEAMEIAQKHSLKEQIRDISEMMVNYYKLREDFENALEYQELFQVYQDSLVNKENVQELERVKSNFEISQRDVKIGQLNERDAQRRQQTFAAVGIMIVFIGLSFLLYRSNRAKHQANQILAAQKDMIRKREEEKALLLKELNHRVKNNLQMISSLLNLQGSDLKGHPAEAAIAAGKFRVDALALIHQKLYREDIQTTIPLKDYIEELVLNLCYSFDDQVKPRMEIAPISLSIDQAIPIALIVNEWVTNALKYAYTGIREPDLNVILDEEKDHLILQVKDNGVGMPVTPTIGQSSFGLKLVHSLAKQLKADIESKVSNGTSWTLRMPLT